MTRLTVSRPAARFVCAAVLILSGCSVTGKPTPDALFDLGPQHPLAADLPALPPIAVADVGVPSWLDRPLMFYRLDYRNPQQPRPYAQSRWSATPAQLLTHRLKSRLAQAGSRVLSVADGASGVPELHVEVDEFTQHFAAADRSHARVVLRAAVYQGRRLLGQTRLTQEAPAPTPDAAGGAQALAVAADGAIDALSRWLATLPLQ